MSNIVDTIRQETATRPHKPAVVDGECEVSYARLLEQTDEVRDELMSLGIRPLDRIALHAADSSEYIIASLAILAAGAVVVPVSPVLSDDEVETVLECIDVRGMLSNISARWRHTDTHLKSLPVTWRPREPREQMDPAYARLNPAFIRFSSGTTGASKGVLLSHETILARTSAADRGLQMQPEDVVLWVLSMSYHFVVSILLFLRRGCTIILCSNGFSAGLLEAVTRYQATFIYASPLHYHTLARSPELLPNALSSVRLAISTATNLPADIARAFAQRFGFELTEAYGIIEVGLPLISRNPEEANRGSVGTPLPDFELRIADPGADGVGEILVRGPGMFDAYFSPWQLSQDCLDDGWFKTGDLGRVGEEGSLFIIGRKKNIINFAGMKVFPDEVEQVLQQHPAIKEAMVYGVPHSQYGQLPHARIVLREGYKGALPDDLRRFCFARLASFKVPKGFDLAETLERTASGKICRHC